MTTPLPSIRSLILDDIVTLLLATNGPSSTYFNSFKNVGRLVQSMPKESPYILVRAEGATDEQVAVSTAYTVVREHLDVAVDFDFPDRESDKATDVEEIVHDIKKCLLLTDSARRHVTDGLPIAIDTLVTGDTIEPPHQQDLRCRGTVKARVEFRYKDSNPSVNA